MKTKACILTSLFLGLAGHILLADDFNLQGRAPQQGSRPVRYISRPWKPSLAAHQAASPGAAVATLPLWQATSTSYSYQMVGANPMGAGSNGTTSITTNVIPVILTFSDGTLMDPTSTGACASQVPQSLVLSSPLFNNSSYSAGAVNVGNTQYPDFFQRASFWQTTGPSGINPNYHLLLTTSPAAAVHITVPAASGKTVSANCGRLGEMDINWFDNYVLTNLFPQLAGAGVMPSTFPIFILYNTVMYDKAATNCCILGYHSGFSNPGFSNAMQTYAVADFDTSGDFGSTQDVSALSHEIGEWMDDPTGTNPTPPWGHIGQVSSCQSDLEVGDPLSGTGTTITMSNGFNYHLQELAFKSWFYRDVPSSGVNGWYSSNGTFTKPSLPCNSSVTSLTINPASIAAGSTTNVSVSVTAAAGASGTPTGNVTLTGSNGPATLATLALSGGKVTAAVAFPAGSYSVTATYSGDAAFSGSSSPSVAITVGSSSVSLSPVALTFTSQNTGTSSAAQTATLTNQGTAPLSISSVGISGASPGDFSETNNCGTSLAAGLTCSISVTFTPSAAGNRTASLSVADNATGSPQTVALSGTGVTPSGGPVVTISPGSLTFPGTAIGVSSAYQTVTITNTGSAALTGLSLSLSGANGGDFGGNTNCGSSLAAKASCTVSLLFTPAAVGSRTAYLSLNDNAPGSPQRVTLSGTGTSVSASSKISLSVSLLSYPATNVGTSSAYQTVTITNTGTGSLTGMGLSLTGANGSDWGGTTDCGSTLSANASCRVSLDFVPSAAGSRTGSLTIRSNAASSPDSVSLSGTGVTALRTN